MRTPYMYINAEVLNLVFQPGPVRIDPGRRLVRQDLGLLKLPGGGLVAVDPIGFFEAETFVEQAPPGSYPAAVFVLEGGQNGGRRPAAALAALFFSDQPAHSWRPALTPGQNEADLTGRAYFGYYADSAAGSFMPAETAAWLNRSLADGTLGDPDEFIESLLRLLSAGPDGKPRAAVNHCFEPARGLGAVIFSAGEEGGCYPSFFGYDRDGRVSCLVTDFLVFESME